MVRAVAAMLALAVVVPATAAQPRAATLKLESAAPLRVSGKHFGSGESVLLTYRGPERAIRVVGLRATRKGAFRARFPVRLGRCDAFTVRAAGTLGSRAVLQVERRCENAKGPPKRAPRVKTKPGEG